MKLNGLPASKLDRNSWQQAKRTWLYSDPLDLSFKGRTFNGSGISETEAVQQEM